MKLNLAKRIRNKVRGVLLMRGSSRIKRSVWNAEFAEGKWDNLHQTHGDCLYPHLEKHLNGGSILDLGCGSGNTGTELAAEAYGHYTGVDISDVAIDLAKKRASELGRAEKNAYFQSDIASYQPAQQFDVILFRESIYYVAGDALMGTLKHYAQHLKQGGVFVVRLWTGAGRYSSIVDFVEANFKVVEKSVSGPTGTVVLVFR